jgi:DNA-binding MarR family transcriptional regulator
MTSSNVAAALRELESAGLVRRVRDPEDGRRVQLSLTDTGANAVSCVHAERDTWLGRAIAAVLSDEEQRTLIRAGELMQRLAEYQDEDDRAAEAIAAAAREAVVRAAGASEGRV